MSTKKQAAKGPRKSTKGIKRGPSMWYPISEGTNAYVTDQYKNPGLRANGNIHVTSQNVAGLTHHGKNRQALKRPRVIYADASGPTCGDSKFFPFMNPKTGKLKCMVPRGQRTRSPRKPSGNITKTDKIYGLAKSAATEEVNKKNLRAVINHARANFLKEKMEVIDKERLDSIMTRLQNKIAKGADPHDAWATAIRAGLRKDTSGIPTVPRAPRKKAQAQ